MFDIYTDSCADLSPGLLEKHLIHIIPLQVFINGINYLDGEIVPEDLFKAVAESGQLPKTSAPSLAEFITKFTETPNDVLFIGISSKLSATLETAIMAANEIKGKKVIVVDSLNLSTGIGLLTLKAADLRDAGMSIETVADYLRMHTDKVRSSFVIDTMEYLYKGGRCSGLQALAGSLLSIRPIIFVYPDGTMNVRHKVRGTRAKAINTMLVDFQTDMPNIDLRRVFVTHSGIPDDAQIIAGKLHALAPVEEVLITVAGATISSHCGPATIGILYMLKQEMAG